MILTTKFTLSLIIPLYQNASTIQRALRSISQRFSKEMEIIIIDDGSTDDGVITAMHLLPELGFIHFKVIQNIRNQGVYYSRNLGVQLAKFEYVMFLDADDELNNECFDQLAKNVIQSHPDLVLFDILLKQEDKADQVLSAIPKEIKEPQLIDYVKAFPSPCNKLVRRSVYIDYQITFPNTIYEDLATSYRLMLYANKVIYLRECFYVYHKAINGSNVSSITDNRITQLYDVIAQMLLDLTSWEDSFDIHELCDIAVPALFNQYLMVLTISDHNVVKTYYDCSVTLLNHYFGSSWLNHPYFEPDNLKQKLIRTMLKSKWSYRIFNRIPYIRNYIQSNYRL